MTAGKISNRDLALELNERIPLIHQSHPTIDVFALVLLVSAEPLYVNEIAFTFGIAISTTSNLVTRTKKLGLVSADVDVDDKRRVKVRITRVGERMLFHTRGRARCATSE